MKNLRAFISGFKIGVRDFGETISILFNTGLLFFVYILGIGITAILSKTLGKHFLDKQISNNAETYWIDTTLGKGTKETYKRRF
ncbi:MAG: hypothetical protein QXW70_01335 [Candidatus Anstonellales archaeon]